jgi:hypothetical protein
MDKKTLFAAVISVFLTVPGICSAFYGNKNLDTISIPNLKVTATGAISCTDSDNGLDYLTKGSIKSQSGTGIFESSDRCLSATRILEYTCKNNAWYANYHECEYGCSNGACLASEASNSTGTFTNNDSDTSAFPWKEGDISGFLEKFLGNIEEQDFDFGQIISPKYPDEASIKDYLSNFISSIDFEDANIEDREDLEEYLKEHTENAEKDDNSKVSSESIAFPDGTLIKIPGDDKVYVIKDGMKEWIETAEEFNAKGYDWKAIQEVNKEILKNIKERIKLVKDELNKVYQVVNGKALWIPSITAFNAAGFKWEDVENLNGDISNYYDEVKLLQDENGNFYHITANGKKQLITNQKALESLMEEFSNKEGSANKLETIIRNYIKEMIAAAEKGDKRAIEEVSAALSDEIQQAVDEITDKITECLSDTDASACINSTDWEKHLENIIAKIDKESPNGISPEEIEAEMESVWKEFEEQMAKSESANNTGLITVTTTQGAGTGETWEEAWEDFLANIKTQTAATAEADDDKIASELENAWKKFDDIFKDKTGSSDWNKFLGNYDYSSYVPAMKEILDKFQDSEEYEDLNSYLSEYEDFLNGGAANLTNMFDFKDVFDISSFKDPESYLGYIEDAKLIQKEGDYKVYEIVNGRKKWITSAEELANKGYSWSDIVKVNPSVFDSYDFGN